jgi:uncharacterized protein with HEPN domain
MTRDRRDISILRKIVNYCDEIDQTIERFGNTYELLQNDKIYQNAAAMCILQIGELVGHLSDEFRAAHSELPWRQIRTMRNIAAHDYENFSLKYLWDTMADDIPELRVLFNKIIEQSQDLPQEEQTGE